MVVARSWHLSGDRGPPGGFTRGDTQLGGAPFQGSGLGSPPSAATTSPAVKRGQPVACLAASGDTRPRCVSATRVMSPRGSNVTRSRVAPGVMAPFPASRPAAASAQVRRRTSSGETCRSCGRCSLRVVPSHLTSAQGPPWPWRRGRRLAPDGEPRMTSTESLESGVGGRMPGWLGNRVVLALRHACAWSLGRPRVGRRVHGVYARGSGGLPVTGAPQSPPETRVADAGSPSQVKVKASSVPFVLSFTRTAARENISPS